MEILGLKHTISKMKNSLDRFKRILNITKKRAVNLKVGSQESSKMDHKEEINTPQGPMGQSSPRGNKGERSCRKLLKKSWPTLH